MSKLCLIIGATVVVLGGINAKAEERPAFERFGFPITQTQVAVLGSASVRERSPTPTLMLYGMPASPHQVAVLSPRPRSTFPFAASASVLRPGGRLLWVLNQSDGTRDLLRTQIAPLVDDVDLSQPCNRSGM